MYSIYNFFNRYRRLVLITCILATPLSISAQNSWLSFGPSSGTAVGKKAKPAMKIVERGLEKYLIDYEFSGGELVSRNENGDRYQLIHIDKFGKLQNPGMPALPARQFTFIVPPGHTAEVRLLNGKTTRHEGYLIYPARKPALDKIGAPEPEFELNTTLYETDALYPENPVSISEEQVYRGNKIVRVQVCPVQCNPVKRELITYSRMRFEIRFVPEEGTAKGLLIRPTRLSKKVLSNLADNGDLVVGAASSTQSTAPSGILDATVHPGGGFLIVTINDFLEAAEAIADWKRRMGYRVEVVSQASWTSAAVKTLIHDRYITMEDGLDFALIIGDHEYVPSEISSLTATHVTDLYYACMDGSSDFTPDIGIGRIPAASASDAATMVNKILNYERNPVTSADFYNHGLSAAYFQHAGSGYAERRFAQTSWEIRQYLINNYGYTVDRQFYTESSVNPTYWNNGYYSNGEMIPDYLQRPNYDWNGNATEISAAINEGRFFVFHRDHGSQTLWGDPYYTVSNINALSNGDLLPVVFSINCLTGQFNYSGTCFSEAFIRHANGGAVGVFCATEVSYSGQNDGLAEGMIDAIWPDPGLVPLFPHNTSPSVTPHEPMYHMGLVLTQGKMRMSETWNGGSPPFGYEQYSYELFHYLGDPTMRMWTAQPQEITATYAPTLFLGQSTYEITGASCSDGIATLYFDGEIIGACQLVNGDGSMTIDPLPQTVGDAELTITAHNYRPLEATVMVLPPGDLILVTGPPAGSTFDNGESVNVTWQTFGEIPNVRIEYTTDGGINWSIIEAGIANTNSYSWTAPAVESDQCMIRVTDTDDDPSDESPLFSIHNLSSIEGTVEGTLPAEVAYSGPMSGSVTTDGSGVFSVARLLPGSYAIMARDNDYISAEQTLTVPPDRTGVVLTILYPEISVTPLSLSQTLAPGSTATQTLTIANNGTAPLEFEADLQSVVDGTTAPADALYPAWHFDPIDKNAPDTREGLPVADGSGGPDTYGYRWIDSNEPGGPAYTWTDISATGTPLSTVSGCDDCSQSVALSFPFDFYGDTFTSLYVSSNGYITFGAGSSSYSNYPLPSTSAPAGIVAPFYDDLRPGSGGTVYFQDFGSYAVVQFDGVARYSGGGYYTFQVHVRADGKIIFYYNDMTSGTLVSATVGMQNRTRDDGFTIAYNTSYLENNLAVEISALPEWLLVSPNSGVIDPGASVDLTVTFDATELPVDTYNGLVLVRHNDPDAAYPLQIPCELTVTGGNLPPVAVVAASPQNGTAPLTVAFDGTGSNDPDGDPLTFSWDFGDGATATGATPSHTYTTAGTYTAILTVDDGNGATDNASVTVVATDANLPPVAVAAADPLNGTAPLTVAFDGTGSSDPDGDPLSFSWVFGDGATATGATPSHTYTTAGTYTAILTVDDGNGATDDASVTVVVAAPNQPPLAVATSNVTGGPVPLAVSFDGSGSSDPDGDPLTFAWDFGDGSSATGATPDHVYIVEGVYTVVLTVDDGNGGSDQAELVIAATQNTYEPGLLAEFFDYTSSLTLLPDLSGSTPDVIRIDAQINYPSTNNPWTGLGSEYAQTFASRHTGYIDIPATGSYTFYLNSDDGSRLWVNDELLIDNDGVHAMEEVSGTVSLTAGYQQIRVEFFENDGGAGMIFSWSGPGISKEVVPASVLYNSSDLNFPPTAVCTAVPSSGAAPLAVSFDGSGSSDPDGDELTFAWDFGDGTTGTGMTVSHTYATIGSYSAVLTVDDGNGNSDQETLLITVTPDYQSGLVAEFFDYSSYMSTLPDLSGSTPDVIRIDDQINYPSTNNPWTGLSTAFAQTFASRHTGYINIPEAGTYTFYLNSDDGSRLWVNGTLLIDNDGLHAMREVSGTVTLGSGFQEIRVEFFENDGGAGLIFSWSGPGFIKEIIPPSVLFNGNSTNLAPTAVVTADPINGIVPLTVTFDGSGSTDPDGDPLTFTWDFGDGNSGSGVTSTHTYTTPGTFTATLTVDDGNGATDEATVTITVNDEPNLPPTAVISADPTSGTVPLTVAFDGSGSSDPDGDPLTFAWDYGDGNSGTGVTPTHTYTTPGTFTTTLTVDDGNGATDEASVTITVNDLPNEPPTAVISADPTMGDAPLPVTFDGSGSSDPDGDPLTFAWDFGDGNSGSGVTPTHTYTNPGTFTATLTVDDGRGGTDAVQQVITVTQAPNQPPLAVATSNVTGGPVPLAVSFDGSGSSDPDGDPLTFAWDFGDGATATGATPDHVYIVEGVYTVVLTVDDGNGGTDQAELVITATQNIYEPGLLAEYFDYTSSLTLLPDLSGSTPDVIRIDAQINYPSTNNPWTGLGSEYAQTFASRHTGYIDIPATGSYTFYLNSDDGSRLWVNDELLIDNDGLHAMQEVAGTVTLTAGYQQIRVEFFENDGGAGMIFSWSGPGISKEVVPASVLYNSSDLNFPPTAVCTVDPSSGTAPLAVSFDGSGSSDPDGDELTFAWDFGDGATATGVTASHTYTTAGTYTAVLTVDDGNGGTDAASATITVTELNDPPVIVTPAAADPDPVTGTTCDLSVLGDDDDGEANLTYTWTATTIPTGGAITFSPNGSNTAKNSIATFDGAGTYILTVTATDQGGLSVQSIVTVTVNQTLSSITVQPSGATVTTGETQQFTAQASDQFGNPMSPAFSWSVSGGGSIDGSGLFTAGGSAGGPFTVTATSGGVTGTATVTVQAAQTGVVIYGDQLAAGYTHYSWGGTYNLDDTSPVRVGERSIAIDYSYGWAGLQIYNTAGTQTLNGYSSFTFWGHGGTSGTRRCQFYVRNSTNQESQKFVFELPANTWTQITVPLSQLGSLSDAKVIIVQDITGNNQPEFNIDHLVLQ